MTAVPRVLVACEFSGTVRDAFLARGFDAWSCDILPDERGSNRHIRGDVRDILDDGWDLIIVAHPPCTRLCKSGLRWLHTAPPGRTLPEMWAELEEAAALFSTLWHAPAPYVAIENPRMHRHAQARIRDYRHPAQVVQPWWFGEPTFKGVGLWLRRLPPLFATAVLEPPVRGTDDWRAWSRIHRMPGSRDRRRERSRFFPGIAAAMAEQWGDFILQPGRLAA
nr:hypothetical protein [Sphingomonas sp. Y57]